MNSFLTVELDKEETYKRITLKALKNNNYVDNNDKPIGTYQSRLPYRSSSRDAATRARWAAPWHGRHGARPPTPRGPPPSAGRPAWVRASTRRAAASPAPCARSRASTRSLWPAAGASPSPAPSVDPAASGPPPRALVRALSPSLAHAPSRARSLSPSRAPGVVPLRFVIYENVIYLELLSRLTGHCRKDISPNVM